MKKFIITGMAVAVLAIPAAASAAQPDGSVIIKGNGPDHTNVVAENSSRVIQNGQFVSGNGGGTEWWQDQTSSPGSRGAYVQSLQASQDRGRDSK